MEIKCTIQGGKRNEKIPENIMKICRQRLGLKPDDTSQNEQINQYSPESAFDECCKWYGMYGWGNTLLGWVEDCFGIALALGTVKEHNIQ